jgi:hypothetical protein
VVLFPDISIGDAQAIVTSNTAVMDDNVALKQSSAESVQE